MGWNRPLWASLILAALVVSPLHAGFYDPQQPKSPLVTPGGVHPLNYEAFRDELDKLAAIADRLKPQGPRAAAIKLRDLFLGRGVASLNPTELAELGAIQWRLQETEAALATLKQATIRDPRNFWALTHLGSVHQAVAQLREALPNLESAKDYFPEPWPGKSQSAADWFKQAERYQFMLLKLRLREEMGRPSGGRAVASAGVDALFGVHFVGSSGQYEAGTIADAERAKLPKDAVAIVQQLLLWFPQDTRLLWLLAELYNAEGNLEAAAKMFDMCVWSRRYDSTTLREHRRIVQDAYDATTKPVEKPVPSLLPGTWQVYTVGTVFGIILLILVGWQFREWIRRLRGAARSAER
jgi:hypothetical protein